MSEFFDSARWGLIPAKSDAMLYYDGRYAATAEDAKRFGRVRWITVLGGTSAAAHAGAADYEPGNAIFETAGRLREWVAERQAMNCRARVYAGRNNLAQALDAVGDLSNAAFWVPTLDNRKWTAAELAADILALGVTLAEDKLWAVQYAGGMTAEYDTSLLYGAW